MTQKAPQCAESAPERHLNAGEHAFRYAQVISSNWKAHDLAAGMASFQEIISSI